MRSDLLRLALLAGAVTAGCAVRPDLSPHVDRLTPAGGPADVATPVVVHGSGFFPRTVQSASGSPVTIDTTHRAWLDDVELAEVTWVDEATLRATIPAGLALGPHQLTVENAHGQRGSLTGAWTVFQPAVLGVAVRPSRTTASTGQAASLEISLSDTGGAAAQGVTLSVSEQGAGGVTIGALPGPVQVAPGGVVSLSVPLTALAAGDVTLQVTASGTEAYSGRALSASASTSLAVQARARLVAALSLPSTIPAGGSFAVTMLVMNEGDAGALAVAPGALALASGSTATLATLAGPGPAAVDVPGHGTGAFTWTAQLEAGGTVQLEGGASGTDANDAGPAVAPVVLSNVGSQQPEVSPIAVDPLGDGTPAAALAVFAGKLVVGPSDRGQGFWTYDPSAAGGAAVGVQIAVDVGSTAADNHAWLATPPATTFGTPGCELNTTACGPSNEDGRGILGAGSFAGSEWLLYSASALHKARYLYLASALTSSVAFKSVDLKAVLPTNADSPTAVAFGGQRLYTAFTDTAAKKSPYLVALSTAPSGGWLDAAKGTDAVELGASAMPGLGGNASVGASTDLQPRIDAIAAFRGLVVLASGGGVMRSTVATPRSYLTSPGDWASATPAGWGGRISIPATSSVGLTPADRAVPALVPFGACGGGPCLVLARNVQGTSPDVGPQLWLCDPTLTGPADACDPGDWSMPATDDGGDLTQLGVSTHGAASVLLATDRYLYLGFDDAVRGAELYRTEVVPGSPYDFKGANGCAASTAGCVGLGGAGLGDPTRTRFFDARAVTSGGQTTVYVAAGDGTGPLHLFALPEPP